MLLHRGNVVLALGSLALACSASATDQPTAPTATSNAAGGPDAVPAPTTLASASAAPPDPELGVSVPSAYAKYCTGTLKTERDVQRATFTGNWRHSGEKAPPGTVFLLDATNGSSGADYGGFLRLPDGDWARIDDSPEKPFTRDVDFSSSCAPPKPPSSEAGKAVRVLIGKATFFKTVERTDKPCVLDAGTEISMLDRYEWLGEGKPVEIALKEMTAKCGWPKAYSEDFHNGELFWK